jgi:hypothetical protein
MSSILDLPRELRQQILACAFENAIEKDINFNMYLRFYTLPGYIMPATPNWFEKLLLRDQGESTDDWDDVDLNELNVFAPNIHKTASALSNIHPLVTDDLPFVLKQCLNTFQQSLKLLLDECSDDCGSNYDPEIMVYTTSGEALWNGWWKKNSLRGCKASWVQPVPVV